MYYSSKLNFVFLLGRCYAVACGGGTVPRFSTLCLRIIAIRNSQLAIRNSHYATCVSLFKDTVDHGVDRA